MTINDFIRKALKVPFKACGRDYEGWDCYGLVRCGYRDVKGVLLPEYSGHSYKDEYDDLKRLIYKEKEQWEEVKDPQEMDIALFSMRSHHPHVALVVNKRQALHAEGNVGTFIENLNSAVWSRRLDGFYRIKNEH